jgi:hypothetical protein
MISTASLTEAVRNEREVSNAGRKKLDFADRDKRKPVLLRLSLAGNLKKTTFIPLWDRSGEHGYGLRHRRQMNDILPFPEVGTPMEFRYSDKLSD